MGTILQFLDCLSAKSGQRLNTSPSSFPEFNFKSIFPSQVSSDLILKAGGPFKLRYSVQSPYFMSNGSPTAYLLWAILACTFLGFLILHIWSYDRFKCLRWGSGRQPGAFKRVMTYSYIISVPLLAVFGVSMSVVKYKEGYIALDGMILPRPFALWDPKNMHWILPLYFVLSIAWGLELVTHLEELTFWLFMLHQGPSKREWFHSWEFRTWYMGSIVAILGLPMTTLISRRNLETCEAWIFLVGSSASMSTNIIFLYVLFRFPGFIRHVKSEGADPDVVVRLATFFNLNVIRVVFRFLFTVPLFIIAMDGIRGPHKIIMNLFNSDFLLMIGGIGCFISSAITLLIFFPRSITRESGYKPKDSAPPMSLKSPVATSPRSEYHMETSPKSPVTQSDIPLAGTTLNVFRYPRPEQMGSEYDDRLSGDEGEIIPEYESEDFKMPTRHTVASPKSGCRSEDTVWERQEPDGTDSAVFAESQYAVHQRHLRMTGNGGSVSASLEGGGGSSLHPYVMHFTSPIDLFDDDDIPRAL